MHIAYKAQAYHSRSGATACRIRCEQRCFEIQLSTFSILRPSFMNASRLLIPGIAFFSLNFRKSCIISGLPSQQGFIYSFKEQCLQFRFKFRAPTTDVSLERIRLANLGTAFAVYSLKRKPSFAPQDFFQVRNLDA